MKKLILALLVSALLIMNAWGADVTLQWEENTEPDLVGYKIYNGTESGVYNEPITVGLVTEYTATYLDNVMHYFVVTAFDTEGLESDYSNEVSCIKDIKCKTVVITEINCN